MTQMTFARFQGMWFGGIVGQAIANQKLNEQTQPKTSPQKNISVLEFPTQNWLRDRRQLSQEYLETYLTEKTEEKIQENWHSQQSSLPKADQPLRQSAISNEHPLKFLFRLLVSPKQFNFPPESHSSYVILYSLVNSLLCHKLEPLNWRNLIQEAQQKLDSPSVKLIEQLLLVSELASEGISRPQLTAKLGADADSLETAIAWSWYCFISNPQDFKLSVLRAANTDSPLAGMITALTGTLSGAHNGILRIPLNWRMRIAQPPDHELEEQMLLKLFKVWLGIYNLSQEQDLFQPWLQAVAISPTIQSRNSLKIISQQ